MIINDFETALQLANEFLATKERENYYDFEAIDEEVSWYVHFANTLTDEEVTRLRASKEKYGEKFLEHLDEVYDDLEVSLFSSTLKTISMTIKKRIQSHMKKSSMRQRAKPSSIGLMIMSKTFPTMRPVTSSTPTCMPKSTWIM